MTHPVPGAGGPRQPDSRLPPPHCAFRTLLGCRRTGGRSEYQSRWEHDHAGDEKYSRSRSAAVAGAGFDCYSGPHGLQDGLEIDRRTSALRERLPAIPIQGYSGSMSTGGASGSALDRVFVEVRCARYIARGFRGNRRGSEWTLLWMTRRLLPCRVKNHSF